MVYVISQDEKPLMPCSNTVGGEHTFHKPIEEKQINDFPELQVKKIDNLITYGDDIADLLSNQFVTKVITLIQSGDFSYVEETEVSNAV